MIKFKGLYGKCEHILIIFISQKKVKDDPYYLNLHFLNYCTQN